VQVSDTKVDNKKNILPRTQSKSIRKHRVRHILFREHYVENAIIRRSSYLSISVIVVVFTVVATVTLFQQVVADDAESYHCYAFNKFGSSSAKGQLVVLSTTSTVFLLFNYRVCNNNKKKENKK